MLSDVATQAKCRPGAPRHAACFRITVTGTTADWSRVSSGGWFDVEAGPGSPACGNPAHYTERIVTTKGTLTVRAAGPRLCAGAVDTVHRTYTVMNATGALHHLSGHGIISLAVLPVGATETWTRPKS